VVLNGKLFHKLIPRIALSFPTLTSSVSNNGFDYTICIKTLIDVISISQLCVECFPYNYGPGFRCSVGLFPVNG